MGDDGEPITGPNATVTSVSASATPNPAPPDGTIMLSASAENATRYARDIDDDGIGEYVGQNVTWTPNGTGEHTVTVRATSISNDADDYAETNFTVEVNGTAYLDAQAGSDGRLGAADLGNVVIAWARGDIQIGTLSQAVNRFGAA